MQTTPPHESTHTTAPHTTAPHTTAPQAPLGATGVTHGSWEPKPDEVRRVEDWLDVQAAAGVHPDDVAGALRRDGWSPAATAWASQRYGSRFEHHPGVWWGGFTAVGFAALAVAGMIHALLDGNRGSAAGWFSIAVVATVFAGIGIFQITRLSADPTQRFSRSRRSAATVLFWCAIAVAVVRGLVYGNLLGQELLVGDDCRIEYSAETGASREVCTDRLGEAVGHLGLTAVIAGPIAVWAWYGHRRPTDPRAKRPIAGSDPRAGSKPEPGGPVVSGGAA